MPAICFLPACAIREDYVRASSKRLSGNGCIFLNDAITGLAWDISFSGKKTAIEKIEFKGKPFLSVEFER